MGGRLRPEIRERLLAVLVAVVTGDSLETVPFGSLAVVDLDMGRGGAPARPAGNNSSSHREICHLNAASAAHSAAPSPAPPWECAHVHASPSAQDRQTNEPGEAERYCLPRQASVTAAF
eukprot:CAMPEP_0181204366 /NCGR_PEP_ID=MMETSP1096-20121128/19898_1 /TAXON_ID=156174 ORGANISM="Chrysochromulina ericina, Strain CCMP281" /NCGR_SAMPLE_ID=MMETSP1096 /ASSEMBLY_ACC=CAM_ASM_000453 /LENGTH=118 /DNA_ID=CAMNT_0023295063 /DNA_START=172 /DNA_END=529 /DNA_ORIENTATION=+